MKECKSTKLSLYNAFDSLICRYTMSKISITDICALCSLNRKSFYYYFEDKYDLANSFFDLEFTNYLSLQKDDNYFFNLCSFLYSNKRKYKHLLEFTGQNSFYDHLRERIQNYFCNSYSEIEPFGASFYADAVTFCIKEWICSSDTMNCDVFYKQLIKCIRIDCADK